MRYLLTMALVAGLGLLVMGQAAGQAGGQTDSVKSAPLTTVIDDHVPVYTRMATGGGVIYELSKGDRVTVQFEMEKSSRAWCSIIYKGETTLSGYVECRHLAKRDHQQWELIQSTGGARSSPNAVTTHIRVIHNQVLVPVNLSYEGVDIPVELLMDTGSSATVIKNEVARRLGVDLAHAINVKAVVMGGGTINVKVVQLTGMTVGPHQIPDLVIGVIEHNGPPVSFDGVLGMDFFGAVDYQVDLRRRVITWGR